ncbi:MAG: hypothetical protein ACYDH3_07810 [Candidatus Aminicenantales bacterium]
MGRLVGRSLPMEKTVEAIHLDALDYLEEPFEGGDVLVKPQPVIRKK